MRIEEPPNSVEMHKIIWFRVRGEIANRLGRFVLEEKIYSPIRSGASGPWTWIQGYFEPEAERIMEWLTENGVAVSEVDAYDSWDEEGSDDV